MPRYLLRPRCMHTLSGAILILFGTIILFVSTAAVLVKYTNQALRTEPLADLSQYTFAGDDFPEYYPINLPYVSLTPENTIHYQIYTTDAEMEWASVFPDGGGFVYLGKERRPFGLALFHQLHCLARIREAMHARKETEHVHHCFNYLRQSILCNANPTIEPVIPILGRRSVNAEVPRICRDWTQVYQIAAASYHSLDFNDTLFYV